MPKILIADDQPDLLTLLSSRFRAIGFTVVEARNGQDALAEFERDRPDIAVLDVMMPELNGFQVCRSIKEREDTRHLPIILLTAKNSEADRFWGSEVGADLYLTKPIDPGEVAEHVKRLLEGRHAEATT